MENTLANVDLGRYRRIVQMFWDPEPVNDPSIDQPVWCLGCSYRLNDAKQTEPTKFQRQPASVSAEDHPKPDSSQQDRAQHIKVDVPPSKAKSDDNDNEHEPVIQDVTDPNPTKPEQVKSVTTPPPNAPDTPPESASSSFSSSLAYDDSEQGGSWPHAFIEDFESRLWMTYRSDFEPIAKSSDPKANSALSLSMRIKSQLGDQAGFSSDSGWGCMIRSGQSLLANTIALLRLGRDWRRGSLQQDERELLRMFADDPRAPYSIHSFVHHGAVACGKYPGEWFGPSATARCIQALTNINEPLLKVYCTGDGPDVYEDSFMKVAKPDGTFHPTLLLVSTRLGIDKITPVYWEALIASLQMSQSVGIAGGRPSSAHYFAGAQGSFLFYLDPHHTRKAFPYHPDPNDYTQEEIDSCHTSRLRRIHVREMDPSMLIGFLIRSEDDWTEWRRCVKHVQGKAIIHVADRDPRLLGADGFDGRAGAIDEVEPLSDDDDDTVLHD